MFRFFVMPVVVLIACGHDAAPPPATKAGRFPRLTHAQWEATTQDLLGLSEPSGLSATFQPDPQVGRFDNNVARMSLGSSLWRDYQRAAETLGERAATDPVIRAKIAPDPSESARSFITRFGLHAFRRPLEQAEIDRYVELFDSAVTLFPESGSFEAGVRLTVQSMLQSPFFLYRSELGTKTVLGIQPLNGYEVASRLSYLLWNTMPDDELLQAAKEGKLDSSEGVRDAAMRMLADPRASAQFRRFHEQLYAIAEYAHVEKNQASFPEWRREIGAMMREEVLRFVDDIVANEGTVAELWTSRRAFVNDDLAKLYGLSGTFGAEYKAVELDETRAGLLTRIGFLARNATLDLPDPIHRGVFINQRVLCREITAPPKIPDDLMRTGNTNRERVTSITGPGTCGEGCHHTIINPVGFAFEHYDGDGSYRTEDNGFPVDSSGTYHLLSGGTLVFADGVELSKELAETREVHECYTSRLLEFILGRELVSSDRAVTVDLADESVANAPIRDLVLSIITSNAFRARLPDRSAP